MRKVKNNKELDFDDLVICRVLKKIMDTELSFGKRYHNFQNSNYTFYSHLEKTLGEKIGENYQEIVKRSDEIYKFISDTKLTDEIIDIFEKKFISLDMKDFFG